MRKAGARTKEERKRIFLQALCKTGVIADAARVASPHAKKPASTFYQWRAQDENFAAEWDEALQASIADVELEVRRRAIEGWEEPVVQRGEVVTTVRRYSDRMLEILAKRWNPAFNEKRQVDVNANVGVQVSIEAEIQVQVEQRIRGATSVLIAMMTIDQREATLELVEVLEEPTPERLQALGVDERELKEAQQKETELHAQIAAKYPKRPKETYPSLQLQVIAEAFRNKYASLFESPEPTVPKKWYDDKCNQVEKQKEQLREVRAQAIDLEAQLAKRREPIEGEVISANAEAPTQAALPAPDPYHLPGFAPLISNRPMSQEERNAHIQSFLDECPGANR